MKNLAFISCALLISFASCQKDEEIANNPLPPAPSNTIDDYTQFAAGNYWLYQHFDIDSTGETASPGYDSCYYTGDTILGGYLYKKVYKYGLFTGEQYLRDSSGFLLAGYPILSTSVVNDTFYVHTDAAFNITTHYIVTSLPSSVTMPAGTFTQVLDVARHIYFMHPDSTIHSVIAHTFYAKDIGKIMEQYYFASELYQNHNIVHERRLIGYHVN